MKSALSYRTEMRQAINLVRTHPTKGTTWSKSGESIFRRVGKRHRDSRRKLAVE
jgi:hypothetical protein